MLQSDYFVVINTDTYIWVSDIGVRGKGENGVIVIHHVRVPVWMALECTSDGVLWLISHDGSHNNRNWAAKRKLYAV